MTKDQLEQLGAGERGSPIRGHGHGESSPKGVAGVCLVKGNQGEPFGGVPNLSVAWTCIMTGGNLETIRCLEDTLREKFC